MRSLRRLARPAVATAAAVLFLAGCGDDDSDSTSSSDSSGSDDSSTETSEESSGDGDIAAWCAQTEVFADQIGQVQTAADPTEVAAQLSEAADSFDAVEAPAEIAEDWAVLGDALRTWADAAGSLDPSDPEAQAEFQQATADFGATFSGPSGEAVNEYGTANCT